MHRGEGGAPGRLLRCLDVDRLKRLPHGLGFAVTVALGHLDVFDDGHNACQQLLCACPSVEPRLGLLDKGKVDHLMNARVCAEVVDSVADLLEAKLEHSNHAHIARGLEFHVVLDAVPERAVKRLANVVEGRILSAASA